LTFDELLYKHKRIVRIRAEQILLKQKYELGQVFMVKEILKLPKIHSLKDPAFRIAVSAACEVTLTRTVLALYFVRQSTQTMIITSHGFIKFLCI